MQRLMSVEKWTSVILWVSRLFVECLMKGGKRVVGMNFFEKNWVFLRI